MIFTLGRSVSLSREPISVVVIEPQRPFKSLSHDISSGVRCAHVQLYSMLS